MKYMTLLILFNQMCSNLGVFDIDTPENLAIAIEKHNNPTEIIVCTGPANYTTFRKGISIGLAFQSYYKCKLFGFSLIEHFLTMFNNQCFYKEKTFVWINDNGSCSLHNIKNIPNLQHFVGNVNINNNTVIDCSINNIWPFVNQLHHSVDQNYFDNYQWQ